MNSALDKNQPELGVPVLAIALHVLSDGDGLLDQMVKILGKGWGKTLGLKDAKNLVTGDPANLGNAVPITEHHTDLGWGHALLGQLGDLVNDIVGVQLQPLQMKS